MTAGSVDPSIVTLASVNQICSTASEDSFLVVNLATVEQQCKQWKQELPNIQPYYAIKCMPDFQIVKTIAQFQNDEYGFDCSSKSEIEMALNAGATPERIIYAHPCKPSGSLKYAREKNVRLLTFDNEEELLKIKTHFPEARLVLRIQVKDAQSHYPLENKFGMPADQTIPLLKLIGELGLELVGVSFHVGCDATNPHAFREAMEEGLEVFRLAKEVLGIDLKLLDLGGGYPGREPKLFKEIAQAIKSCPLPEDVKVIAEPGRFFVGACASVFATIIGKRVINGVVNYHINEGLYGILSQDAIRFLVPVPLPVRDYGAGEIVMNIKARPDSSYRESKIWGPTCDSVDVVSKSCKLPDLKMGDRMAFHEVGAYTVSCSTNFCGFRTVSVVYLQ